MVVVIQNGVYPKTLLWRSSARQLLLLLLLQQQQQNSAAAAVIAFKKFCFLLQLWAWSVSQSVSQTISFAPTLSVWRPLAGSNRRKLADVDCLLSVVSSRRIFWAEQLSGHLPILYRQSRNLLQSIRQRPRSEYCNVDPDWRLVNENIGGLLTQSAGVEITTNLFVDNKNF